MARTITTVLNEVIEINNSHRFVIFTDRHLSGWGAAENKISKRVIICDNWNQAQRLEDALKNAPQRHGFRYITSTSKLPYYNPNQYKVSYDLYKGWNHDLWMKFTNIPETK